MCFEKNYVFPVLLQYYSVLSCIFTYRSGLAANILSQKVVQLDAVANYLALLVFVYSF